MRRFRIAFSFSGEKRDFVAKTAALLARRFGEGVILYDKYHESAFAIYNLGIRLPELYGKESDLIVPVFCSHYDKSRWTGWEWVQIHGLLTSEDGHRVLLSRFDDAIAPGLAPGAGFIELDDKTPEEFATLILERLAENERLPKDFYTRPPALPPQTSIQHNLPTLQPFFGREEELRKIAGALDPENRGWGALIDGPGGMGKTSLAVRAAYDASPDDFKRIAFVTLKTRELDDEGERDLSGFILSGLVELFNELARELGHLEIGKALEEQRPRLLLDALRGTQTLLLLDNLESLTKGERDRLFTFIQRLPQGCKAILTARGRIGSGAQELILERLSQVDALVTLDELAGRNPLLARTSEAERIALYTHTGGSPLLLRWTAGQLGRGHCLTFADAIHFLHSCPVGNDPLEFVFGDLVEEFSSEETRVLSALTYFTLSARVEHVAELAECPAEEASRALRSLSVRSLAVPNDESQTYTLVPLVADFLRKHRAEVIAETGDRLEKRAYALAVENGYQQHERFPVLEVAWPTVAAALPRFLRGPNDRLQKVCDALNQFLDFSGRWDERLALSQDAERRAVAAGDSRHAGWRAYEIGWIHGLRGQPVEVLDCAARAEAHWRRIPTGAREQAVALMLRGFGQEMSGDYLAALASYREAAAFDPAGGREDKVVAIRMSSLADARLKSGDVEGAESDYREALRIARGIPYPEGVASFTVNLAKLALARKDWSGAEALAREALPLSEKVGRLELVAEDCRALAQALARQGRKSEAHPHAQRAVDIYARLGSPDVAGARTTLAQCEAGTTSQSP